jgi:glycosyltransferase involved in cell wall biosynthesis
VQPLVSICIPAYNTSRYLRECLNSALAQTFADFEVVLVDNASTDETSAIAEEYALHDPRIRCYRNEKNLGVIGNWNRCIGLARGEWIKFLCADDWLEPTCLARMVTAASAEVLVVVAAERLAFGQEVPEQAKQNHLRYWTDHSLLPRRFQGQSHIPARAFARLVAEDPTFNCVGSPNALMIRRKAFEHFGRANPDLITHDDWELCARFAVQRGLCYVEEPLANFRQHHSALSVTAFTQHRFKMEIIAPLIIRHEVAYAPVYAPVREAAKGCFPRINLRYQLIDFAREAGRLVHQYSSDPRRPDPHSVSDWNETIRKYPGVLAVPPGYYWFKIWRGARRRLQRATVTAGSPFASKSARPST